MTKRTYGHTKTGAPTTDGLVEELPDEAEAGYDAEQVRARPPRPRHRVRSSWTADRLDARASASGTHVGAAGRVAPTS